MFENCAHKLKAPSTYGKAALSCVRLLLICGWMCCMKNKNLNTFVGNKQYEYWAKYNCYRYTLSEWAFLCKVCWNSKLKENIYDFMKYMI